MELRQLRNSLCEILFVGDRVPSVDSLGLVTREFGGYGAGNAGALEIPHGRTPQIVYQHSRVSSGPAGLRPCVFVVHEPLPAPVEHPGDDAAPILLQYTGCCPLTSKQLVELRVGGEREYSTFAVLRRALAVPDRAG